MPRVLPEVDAHGVDRAAAFVAAMAPLLDGPPGRRPRTPLPPAPRPVRPGGLPSGVADAVADLLPAAS